MPNAASVAAQGADAPPSASAADAGVGAAPVAAQTPEQRALEDEVRRAGHMCVPPAKWSTCQDALARMKQARLAAAHKEERLELLHRYLTGTDFRHRVEAVVEAFAQMRQDLEQERRAAERQWSRRTRQLEAVTLNVAGMYGDLQGLVPALPSIGLLEAPGDAAEDVA